MSRKPWMPGKPWNKKIVSAERIDKNPPVARLHLECGHYKTEPWRASHGTWRTCPECKAIHTGTKSTTNSTTTEEPKLIPLALPNSQEEKPQITPLGQQILDTILDVVANELGMGFIGWSLGKTEEITAYVAKKLGKPNKSIDGGLAHLVSQGYLSNQTENDGTWEPTHGNTCVRHEGWLAYCRWDISKVNCRSWNAGNETLTVEDWLAWDGIDGTAYPFEYSLPDWNKLAAELPEASPQPAGELVMVPPRTCEPDPSRPSPLTSLSKNDFSACARMLNPEQLLCSIKHSHEQAQMNFGRGLEWAFTCGRYLLWMKQEVLEHCEYESWVNANCPFKIRQAQRYTRLVRKWEEIEAKASSEDAFATNSVAGLLEYVKEEAPLTTAEETPAEALQEAAAEEASPTADAGADGDTEAEGEEDETATSTSQNAVIPFPGGSSTTPSDKPPNSKPKRDPKSKPEHQNWRLPRTAKFKKIERVGTELFHALWVDGTKSYALQLTIEQAAQVNCNLTNEFALIAEMEEAKANELE